MTAREVETSLTARAATAFTEYREGDLQALHRLVAAVTPVLWHVARSCGLSQQNAEDTVQTTWLKLVEHADGIITPEAVLGWLCTTTKREAWRVQRLARTVDPVEEPERDPVDETPHDPAQVAALNDEARRLWGHFVTLSPRCQQILRVVCMGGAPDYAGLAEAMGVPIGSIGPTRGRCLAALRRALLDDPHWSLT
ncbi:MAG TPA: RNA polymerase sigma factor [Propionibacteriaceae bacterium]|nr:RNA polymerase sigma factor [Propionibacteriaceae bacterium]